MKDLLMYLTTSLVDEPSKVEIEEIDEENKVIFKLHVDERDMGKIIGKQGKNAQSIRTIMKAAGSRLDKKVIVDII